MNRVEEQMRKYLSSELFAEYISEKTRLERQLERARFEMEVINRELAMIKEVIAERNEYVMMLREKIKKVNKSDISSITLLKEIETELEKIISKAFSWYLINTQFSNTCPSFHSTAHKLLPTLTNMETKICALLRLDMKTKDIAGLLSISERTVELHRLKIRKKMNLKKHESLVIVLQKFHQS